MTRQASVSQGLRSIKLTIVKAVSAVLSCQDTTRRFALVHSLVERKLREQFDDPPEKRPMTMQHKVTL